MKVSDFVAEFIAAQLVNHVFVLQGGAALHLIDSVEKHPLLSAIPMQHEQSSAMAADGYAKASDNLGVTISTSGPGATNLLTGIACSYFDSVPTIHVTGNVASFRQSDDLGVRQYGFQETDIVSMAKPITKYAIRIKSAQAIVPEMIKAITIALSGRPGPVLIDIPDDLQRAEINVSKDIFSKIYPEVHDGKNSNTVKEKCNQLIAKLANAKRPVLILGAGLTNKEVQKKARMLAKHLGVPYLTTWPLKGISDSDDPLNLGSFGTHSYRGNNIVLQNADFILSIGSRLDSRATAKLDTFARNASIFMVDIDQHEIEKFSTLGKELQLGFAISSDRFLSELQESLSTLDISLSIEQWRSYINNVRSQFNFIPNYTDKGINPYLAAKHISSNLKENDVVVVDTGTCLPLTLVYGEEKQGQKYISSYNNTPMGYALPAAIGAHFATGQPITCINGDGGLQMNIQELATVNHYKLPICIWVYNNAGHCMIKQTQDDWLDGNYFSADTDHGLPKLHFTKIAQSYGLESSKLINNSDLKTVELEALDAPTLNEIEVSPSFRYEPIIKYGNPLENMNPILPQQEINDHMLVPSILNRN